MILWKCHKIKYGAGIIFNIYICLLYIIMFIYTFVYMYYIQNQSICRKQFCWVYSLYSCWSLTSLVAAECSSLTEVRLLQLLFSMFSQQWGWACISERHSYSQNAYIRLDVSSLTNQHKQKHSVVMKHKHHVWPHPVNPLRLIRMQVH